MTHHLPKKTILFDIPTPHQTNRAPLNIEINLMRKVGKLFFRNYRHHFCLPLVANIRLIFKLKDICMQVHLSLSKLSRYFKKESQSVLSLAVNWKYIVGNIS